MKRSLYREYRPQTFAELVGQDHVARTLRNAVETGAVAHAYVFAGPRGTGKTSTARILAKALDCVGPEGQPVEAPTATPCGVCRHCVAIADGVSLDVVEMDAASNRSIDDVRDLRDKIAFAPVDGRFKVYIIDEVHMLTREAFNALLKTLEEPPPNVVFVLATTEPHKIPETIISRCQRFDFHRPQVVDIVRLLAGIVERENARTEDDRGGPPIDIQDEALHIIARHSQGGFRDAIGTLDKLVAYAEGTIAATDVLEALGVTSSDLLFEITDIVTERRTAEALQFVQRLANEGADYSQFIRDLLRHLRQLFLLQHLEEAASDDAALRTLGQTVELEGELFREHLQRAGQVPPREVVFFIEALGRAQREIRDGLDPRLQLELALVKVTRPELDHSAAALEERLRRLEAGGGAAAPAAIPAAAPARRRTAEAEAEQGAPGAKPEPATATAAATTAAATAPDASPAAIAAAGEAPTAETAVAPAATAPGAASAAAAPEPADQPSVDMATPIDTVPPTADAATPPAAGGGDTGPELTLERVKRAWELILQRVQAARVPLYGFLRDGRPSDLDGADLVISLPSDFALRNAKQGDNGAVLAAAIETVLGRQLTPRFELTAGAAETEAPPETPGTATLDFTAFIKQAKGTLNAEELPDDS